MHYTLKKYLCVLLPSPAGFLSLITQEKVIRKDKIEFVKSYLKVSQYISKQP